MIDPKTLYEVYKECAWREYDLIDRRMNWVYIANTVLAIVLGVVFQEQLSIIGEPQAMQRIAADGYASSLFSASKLIVLVVPIAAVSLNIALWSQVLGALFTAEGVRKRWRVIRDDPQRGASELPYVGFGFYDAGPRARGAISTSLLLIALIGFWAGVGVYGFILMAPKAWAPWHLLDWIRGW